MSRRSTLEDLRVELDKLHIASRRIERIILQLEEEEEQREQQQQQQQQQRKTPKNKDQLTDLRPKDRDGEEICRKSSSSTTNSTTKYKFRHTWFSDISVEAYINGIVPEEEDIVRIVNPNKGQARLGKIIDFCKDGKIKVDTDQETPIIRAPKNVMLLSREDEASSYY